MKKITFVIPSRNNLEFLKLAYKSIRNLETKHDILILNDASVDGTSEWIRNLNDPDVIAYENKGPQRIGIVGMFDKGIESARTEIIFAFHADMVAAPDLDKHILKYLKKGTVVSATRVEPPLHPDGPEKMLVDFGIEVEDFNIDKFNNWVLNKYKPKHNKDTTEGIFAPWCMYKEDFLAIGGHDELFAPQSKEDSDLFNRFILNGYKVLQTWEGLVYHFTSRGSRFNKHAGGAAGRNSNEWLHTTTKNMRNFIRKWGTVVKHDALMKPIISPKYSIGIKVENCTSQLLEALEPWCDKIYVDEGNIPTIIKNYINLEQPKTNFNLQEKIHTTGNLSDYTNNGFFPTDIFIKVDGNTFNNQDYSVIQQFSEIIQDSGEIGEFELGNLKIIVNNLKTYENNLIINEG